MPIMSKPKIIAVDMDGYLCKEVCWNEADCLTATPDEDKVNRINKLHLANFIVIYTARRDDLLPNTIRWLKKNGINYHAISNNKMPADCYLDDKMALIEDL